MKTFFVSLSVLCALFFFTSCAQAADKTDLDLRTVDQLDLNRYLGKWYEIARFDHSFERGTEACTAEYSLRPDNKIQVINTGYKTGKDKWKISKGKAKLPNPETAPGNLQVSFFLWFYGDYNVLELDQENYNYVLIGGSSDKFLWILSRTPVLPEEIKNELLEKATQRGYDVSKLIWVNQDRNL